MILQKPGGFNSLLAAFAPGTKKIKSEVSGIKQSHKNIGSSSIRVGSERLDELMNLVSELVTTQARLSLFSTGK